MDSSLPASSVRGITRVRHDLTTKQTLNHHHQRKMKRGVGDTSEAGRAPLGSGRFSSLQPVCAASLVMAGFAHLPETTEASLPRPAGLVQSQT